MIARSIATKAINPVTTVQETPAATYIFGLVAGMGIVRFLARWRPNKDVRVALNETPIIPLIGIGIALIILSDFEAIRDVVLVFTLLAFITSVLLNSTAFNTLQLWTGRKVTFKPLADSPLGKSIAARKETK
jgi:multisubunit Na+/H+ antiporter MnhF subunit